MPTWWYWVFMVSMVLWVVAGLAKVIHGAGPPNRLSGLVEILLSIALVYGVWVSGQ